MKRIFLFDFGQKVRHEFRWIAFVSVAIGFTFSFVASDLITYLRRVSVGLPVHLYIHNYGTLTALAYKLVWFVAMLFLVSVMFFKEKKRLFFDEIFWVILLVAAFIYVRLPFSQDVYWYLASECRALFVLLFAYWIYRNPSSHVCRFLSYGLIIGATARGCVNIIYYLTGDGYLLLTYGVSILHYDQLFAYMLSFILLLGHLTRVSGGMKIFKWGLLVLLAANVFGSFRRLAMLRQSFLYAFGFMGNLLSNRISTGSKVFFIVVFAFLSMVGASGVVFLFGGDVLETRIRSLNPFEKNESFNSNAGYLDDWVWNMHLLRTSNFIGIGYANPYGIKNRILSEERETQAEPPLHVGFYECWARIGIVGIVLQFILFIVFPIRQTIRCYRGGNFFDFLLFYLIGLTLFIGLFPFSGVVNNLRTEAMFIVGGSLGLLGAFGDISSRRALDFRTLRPLRSRK